MFLIKARAQYHISHSSCADESCYWRRKFRTYMLFVICIYPIGLLIYMLNVPVSESKGFVIGLTSAWTALCFASRPVYAIRPDQIRKKHFILYLRGFSQDNYSQTIKELNKEVAGNGFSEGHFIHLLKQYMPVYAVGMTREFEAPHGALRVYLDDSVWEDEVEKLMDKARLIVILVNDSESCIWELRHARKYKDKIVYICDNQDKVLKVREFSSKSYESIIPIGLQAGRICFYDNNDHKSVSLTYDNSNKGYSSVIHTIMKNKFNLHRIVISNKTFQKWCTYLAIFLFTPFMLGVSFYVDTHTPLKDDIALFMTMAIITLVCFCILPLLLYDISYASKRNLKISKMEAK